MKKIRVNNLYGENIYIELYEDILLNLEAYKSDLSRLNGQEIKLYFHDLRKSIKEALVEYLIEKNQYINIDKEFNLKLDKVYNSYVLDIMKEILAGRQENLLLIFNNLNFDLLNLLARYEEIARIKTSEEAIPNFEYSGEKQLEILKINEIMEPVLDIGCGKNHKLVTYLRRDNMEVYGIDRYSSSESFIENISWLEYGYKSGNFGTIVAHMSFSNHFIRENLKLSDLYIKYAETYMKILDSLKLGGSFYYTPSLEFIEKLLDEKIFKVDYTDIKNGYKSVKITKIS